MVCGAAVPFEVEPFSHGMFVKRNEGGRALEVRGSASPCFERVAYCAVFGRAFCGHASDEIFENSIACSASPVDRTGNGIGFF